MEAAMQGGIIIVGGMEGRDPLEREDIEEGQQGLHKGGISVPRRITEGVPEVVKGDSLHLETMEG